MKLLNTIALVAALSITASSAFALPANKMAAYKAGMPSAKLIDEPTWITVVDNTTDEININVQGTSFNISAFPAGYDNHAVYIENDYSADPVNLVITDSDGQSVVLYGVTNHAVVNVRYDDNGNLIAGFLSK